MLKKALAVAFARGVGGGLAMTAVPYLVSGGIGAWQRLRRAGKHTQTAFEDAADAARYYGELRGHRKQTGKAPRSAAEMGLGTLD